MIPIHPAQTACRDGAELPMFLKPTTHMGLISLSRFLQTTTTFGIAFAVALKTCGGPMEVSPTANCPCKPWHM